MTSAASDNTRPSLISRVRVDDSQAWRELVELYGPLVNYWCRKRGLERAACQDCVQNVFLSVLRSIDRYQPQLTGGGFRAWLWTIAKHKIIDTLRQGKLHVPATGGSTAHAAIQAAPDPASFDQPDASEDVTEPLQLKGLLLRAVRQVRAEFETKTWQAFERTVVDGLSTEVVAAELSISPAAVRQYRARILRRLRQQLGDIV